MRGNTPHRFVWYNRSPEEFEQITKGKTVGEARVRGRWLFVALEPGYLLVFGEFGGRMLYHSPGSTLPKKHHLCILFDDGSSLTVTTQMWGAMELYRKGQEQNRQYIKGMRTTPVDPEFTYEYFSTLVDDLASEKKRSVKGLLTQEQSVPGLGNAIAQDILFRARLHPKHTLDDLDAVMMRKLYDAILRTVDEITEQGGRYDEVDLYGSRGGYVRLMDKDAIDRPCPGCGAGIEKIQYLGGACYFCPSCQKE
jgi:formamidopyrimidine-DNA glycosylase